MNNTEILLSHGGGGSLTEELLEKNLFPHLIAKSAERHGDSAVLDVSGGKVAFTTDSFVVSPWKFPGGDIGRLAVCGTVNDLAVSGATPRYLSLALIMEEGFEANDLTTIAKSIQQAANEADVEIVTGDTKVVQHGKGDGIYINTSGIGVFDAGDAISVRGAQAGDAILISGTLGDHGMAVMHARDDLGIMSVVKSDVAPLCGLTNALRDAGVTPHVLKDPTRGGLAMVLNEVAEQSRVHVRIQETAIPSKPAVARFADLLGLDLLEVANEGKLVVICPPDQADAALNALRSHPLGKDAVKIGDVVEAGDPLVTLTTRIGGERVLIKPAGESLPRIC